MLTSTFCPNSIPYINQAWELHRASSKTSSDASLDLPPLNPCILCPASAILDFETALGIFFNVEVMFPSQPLP